MLVLTAAEDDLDAGTVHRGGRGVSGPDVPSQPQGTVKSM